MKNTFGKRCFAAVLLLLAFATGGRSQLVINELMPSNVDCVMDDLNDFPDSWVELYNPSDRAVNLGDYRIGKKAAAATAWRLPTLTVAAHGYVLVCCDKVGSGLHTDFRIESDRGCSVFLLQGEQPVDWVLSLPEKPLPNTAYGRSSDGGDEWGFLLTPTPGSANAGGLAKGTLGTPQFSSTGRVQTDNTPLRLEMGMPEDAPEGTHIRYTTDGSEPTPLSTLYEAPLDITATTIVRARLFCDGFLSPPSSCHSYIFFPQDRPLTLPVVSIATDERYLYDPLIGIYTDGSYQEGKANYNFNWRRPVNVELFETSGVPGSINQLCETRIFGGTSRTRSPKSLAIYAKKRFGTKRFNYEFFPDQRPGFADYKSIALRNAGQDCNFLYMRDALVQRAMAQNSDLDWQSWRPAIVYFNGSYQGMLNLRDRSNEDNIYTYYDGLEDIDMVDVVWLKTGTDENYKAFKAFYSEPGHTMAEYERWMDCQEDINLMAMNIYHRNIDVPGGNIVMWRPRNADGRWRWIAKDIDWGMGLYGFWPEYDYVSWLYDNNYDSSRNWANRPEHTLLFRNLMDDSDFRREFIDHLAVYMGDFLCEKGILPVWEEMVNEVKVEMPFHRKRYGLNSADYEADAAHARSWLAHRAANVYQHLANHYGLGTPIPLTITAPAGAAAPSLAVNGIPLRRGAFDGMFFAGRQLTVEAVPADGQDVEGWRVELTDHLGNTTSTIVHTVGGDLQSPTAYTFDMPDCDSLALHPITTTDDGITTVRAAYPSAPIYSLTGTRLAKPQKGINIVGGKKRVVVR